MPAVTTNMPAKGKGMCQMCVRQKKELFKSYMLDLLQKLHAPPIHDTGVVSFHMHCL